MKLSKLKEIVAESERVATITVYQPDGEPYRGLDGKESTISFTGAESRAYALAFEEIQRYTLNSRALTVEPSDLLDNRIKQAAAVVTGWSGWEDDNDQPLVCNQENVRAQLRVRHILTQLENGINAHARFFAKRSSS